MKTEDCNYFCLDIKPSRLLFMQSYTPVTLGDPVLPVNDNFSEKTENALEMLEIFWLFFTEP